MESNYHQIVVELESYVPWKKWTRDSLNRRIKICQETVTVPSLKKKEAARLMIIEGLSGSEVSEKLGVNSNMLYRWKSQHLEELEGDKRAADNASPKEMAAEIARLRKQLGKSERINEILKKTVGYFAKEE